MADRQITTAVQKGATTYVYSGNSLIFTKSGDLYGYTASTVSIKKGNTVYVYNANGVLKSTHTTR